jgi:hypothetical protein
VKFYCSTSTLRIEVTDEFDSLSVENEMENMPQQPEMNGKFLNFKDGE